MDNQTFNDELHTGISGSAMIADVYDKPQSDSMREETRQHYNIANNAPLMPNLHAVDEKDSMMAVQASLTDRP